MEERPFKVNDVVVLQNMTRPQNIALHGKAAIIQSFPADKKVIVKIVSTGECRAFYINRVRHV